MMYCCKNNLSQVEDNNANEIQVMAYIYYGTFMVHMEVSIFELVYET
jgi:hypothetical protein